MFLYSNSGNLNNHSILPDLQNSSNHASLTVDIIINEKFIQNKWQTIIKNSEEEKHFVIKLKNENP